MHLDSTSFHVDGRYNSEEEPEAQVIHITRGYSRDHRPDLYQVMLEVIVEHQAGIPGLMHPLSGNSSDVKEFGPIIKEHIARLQTTYGTTYLVADSALYSEDNLYKLAATKVKWITRVPATLSDAQAVLAQAMAHPYSLALAQHFAAFLHHRRREASAVQTYAETLLTLATAHGFPLYVGYGTCYQGWALAAQGQGEAGLAEIRRGLSRLMATGLELSRPLWFVLLAEVAGQVDPGGEGGRLLAEALAAFETSERGDMRAEAYRLQGEWLLRQAEGSARQSARRTEAETWFRQALTLARHQQAKSWELRAALSLSRLWQQCGKRQQARQLLVEVYAWFSEGFDTADLQETQRLLEALT